MKHIFSFAVAFLILVTTTSQKQPPQKLKTYPISATVPEYQDIILGLQTSTALSAQRSNELINIISQQVQKQIEADTVKPKK